MTTTERLLADLNHPSLDTRLGALAALKRMVDAGELPAPARTGDVNNHIHTWYSFSPYSPAKAVWLAYNAGLATAGIMDHDSVAGLAEFRRAGELVGLPTTGGAEIRVSFAGTPAEGRRINNPDQSTVAYMTLHGVPLTSALRVERFLAPRREARGRRNEAMTKRLSDLFSPHGLSLDYINDVLPLSKADEGGSVTERHILFALAGKLIDRFGCGEALVGFLVKTMGVPVGEKSARQIAEGGAFARYDLLGVLKAGLVEQFYIDAADECPPARDAVRLCEELGAIAAYAYLGDVGDSVTGDKKTQAFEDSYLDELFSVLTELGYHAVTYMPSRNSAAQLARVRSLCETHAFFQISGEDINSPRQPFVCLAARAPEFANLTDAAYALIGHERESERDESAGLFGKAILLEYADLGERVARFAAIGRALK